MRIALFIPLCLLLSLPFFQAARIGRGQNTQNSLIPLSADGTIHEQHHHHHDAALFSDSLAHEDSLLEIHNTPAPAGTPPPPPPPPPTTTTTTTTKPATPAAVTVTVTATQPPATQPPATPKPAAPAPVAPAPPAPPVVVVQTQTTPAPIVVQPAQQQSSSSSSSSVLTGDSDTITLSYYVFGLLAFGSCVVGSIFSYVCCRLCGRSNKDID